MLRGRWLVRIVLFISAFASLISGCHVTSVKFYTIGEKPPLCRPSESKAEVLVYWGTAWRSDQKEAQRREEMVSKAMVDFFTTNRCFSPLKITKTIAEREALSLSDSEVLKAANSKHPGAEKIFLIRIEELSPNLILYLSPILWETKNEVWLRVRSINAKTGSLEADVSTHWTRGGPFTFLGAGSLPIDLSGVLKTMFFGPDAIQ